MNGPALRAIRQSRGVAVADLTEALQCTPSYFSHLETGRRRRCSPLFLSQLCEALGLTDRRALLACPYGEESHEQAEPAHDELADTAELERPAFGGEVPRLVAAPTGAPVTRADERPPPARSVVPAPRAPRSSPKHRATR